MPNGNLRFKGQPRTNNSLKQPRKHLGGTDEDLDTYIEIFIENGLKLQDELMVNHEAIDAAQREYVAEFQRKRQILR